MIFRISSSFISSIIQNLTWNVLLAKSLQSEYAALHARQPLPNFFLNECFKSPVSLNFLILSQCLLNSPQALWINLGCLKCDCCVNLSPANKNFLKIIFILKQSFQINFWKSSNLLAYQFWMNFNFFLQQTIQLDKSVNLFCLDFLASEFLLLAFFSHLTQYASIVFMWGIIGHQCITVRPSLSVFVHLCACCTFSIYPKTN